MKKIAFYLSLACAGLFNTACTEDYTDWAKPQANPQEAAITIPGFTATAASKSAIDLATVSEASVKLLNIDYSALPEGTTPDKLRIVVTPEGAAEGTEPATINATDAKGYFSVADLQQTVTQYFGKRPSARTLDCHAYLAAMLKGQAAYIDAGTFQVKVTPKAPQISSAYYIVGGTLDWAASAASKAQKFSHSDKDVFEDPIFSIIIPANAGGETWFAIGDDEACDAIANDGDWSKLYGTTAGNGQNGATGTLARRAQLSDDGSLKWASAAAQIKITLNMLDGTFTISDVAPQYFMVGALPGWNAEGAAKALLYPVSASVMTYTSKFTGAWDLKVWNRNDIGNWDNCYGCVVDGCNDATGALVSSGAQAISAPSAEFYTFTFDIGTMTYSWTKLDNQAPTEYEAIGIIGDFNSWGGDIDMQQVTPHNWYATAAVTDGGLKFRANHDWGTNWGADLTVDDGTFYANGQPNGSNIQVPAGTYAFYLNDITGQIAILKQ